MTEYASRIEETNGTYPPVPTSSRKRGKARKLATPKPRRRTSPLRLTARQRIAALIGAVATAVLTLSLWHCTEALAALTGSPLVLSALLAIGIDAGLVACELGAIIGDGRGKLWCECYVLLAIALSVALNAYASAHHAETMVAVSAVVGGLIPILVYVGFRAAGHLYRDRPEASR
jgi:hypothetical protein